jgi:hypothetical protein
MTCDYEAAKNALEKFANGEPLRLQLLDRDVLEERAVKEGGRTQSLEQQCVNYLRHSASDYDELSRKLNRPDELGLTGVERHVLHVERRRLVARLKQRVLDEIAERYPWLRAECLRQKERDGVEDDPGEFVLPFGPFKGWRLREVETDYLIRLLGQSFVRRSYRTRIERALAERMAAGCNPLSL